MSLKSRDRQDEWMDQPGLDASLHAGALAGLARVNRISGTPRSLWRPIMESADGAAREPLRVLDVACGGGDIAIAVKQRADREGIPMQVTGCDLSQTALDYAAKQAERAGVDVSFVQCDAIEGELPDGYDAVYTSLFVHHLEGDQIVRLLRSMGRASRGRVIINDLIRSTVGYALARWGIHVLTRNPVCHVDAPLSVRAALTIPEILSYVEAAPLRLLEVHKVFPERYVLSCAPS